MCEKITNILLTGSPGVGKTTLIRKIIDDLRMKHVRCEGFITEEIRSNKERVGFDVITLEGKRGILSRSHPNDGIKRPLVGKYSVYVGEFEAIVLPLLAISLSDQLLVLDEIGKMELISKRFERAVDACIDHRPILATVPLKTARPLAVVERLKNSPSSRTYVVTKENRNHIQVEIMKGLMSILLK